MNYYDECFQKIEQLIQDEKYQEAIRLISEELSMPYVPMDVENKLREYLVQCPKPSAHRDLSDEEIEEWLFLDETHQLLAVQSLSKRNIRSFMDLVKDVFMNTTSDLVRIALLEQCILQQVQDECQMRVHGLDFTFIPAYLELPHESDGVIKAGEYLEEWLINENPSLLDICHQSLIKEAYLRLPLSVDEDESLELAVSILRYISQLMGCENEVNALLFEKNVAQIGQLELLLYSNHL